ncbi:hypothetical protein BDZ94DRAFT_1246387 [Collybia nuda]|uniref:Uncharacterized protein n=1 Tax=Collybia nuda TaxID=64659 RepID=A0A9P5YI59_9AGAR|nr:hypothetical protein BDZ94DRAFT_1246387 [Collybia nuda]
MNHVRAHQIKELTPGSRLNGGFTGESRGAPPGYSRRFDTNGKCSCCLSLGYLGSFTVAKVVCIVLH